MNASRFLMIATLLVAMIVLGACAPAPTPAPTAAPPTAAPPPPAATSTTAPTTAPTAAPATSTTAPTTAAATTAPGAASITLNLGPGRDGDQTPGTAVLTAKDTKTEVVLNLKPAAAGVSQPAHIHDGACPAVGAVKYPLTNVVDGKSTTTVDAKLADLLTGGFAVNVHESTANAGKYVACANIPKGAVLNLDKGRDGDQTPGTAVLLSAGTKTDVFVNIKPAAAGVSQPIHIHDGTCPGVGAVKYPLTNVVDGKSKTTVDASLDDLLKGTYSVNIHESTANSGKYVACAGVKTSASSGAPASAPVAAPTSGQSGGGGGGYP
jgi:hypothetical protein